ncbi:hypothetical protein WN943_020626 [Citrus x changshan-huyou]
MGYMTIYHISRLFFKYDKFDSDQSNVSKSSIEPLFPSFTGMWWCIIYKWGLLPLVFAKVFVVGMRIGNVVATCCPYLIVLWDNLTSEYGHFMPRREFCNLSPPGLLLEKSSFFKENLLACHYPVIPLKYALPSLLDETLCST